jgi:hypothetical protein
MSVSLIYGQGNLFSTSINEGSMYVEVSYTKPLTFDNTLTITEPIGEAIVQPTVSNYPQVPHNFFMGFFDGFWVHKIYRDRHLVYTTQGVDQDLFIPIQHDRIESVSMNVAADVIPGPYEGPVRPPVPSPGVSAMLGLAALCAWGRQRFA